MKNARLMEMARILEIGNYPPPMCGWAIQTQLLQQEFKRRNHTCLVLKINEGRQNKSSQYVDVQNGIDYLYKLIRFSLQGFRFHAHVNAESPKGYILALLAVTVGQLFARPAILTFHGGLPQTYFPRQDSHLLRAAFQVLFRLAGRLTCDSAEIRTAIEDYGIRSDKVATLPCFSAELLHFEVVKLPEEIEQFMASHHPIFSCYVSFRPEYQLPVLHGAMNKFLEVYPKAGFIWLGFPEKEMPSARSYVNGWPATQRDHLLLLGNLNHDEFLTLVSRCSACVRTPACDGISASVIEALALGTPVIASENGRRPKGVVTYREDDAYDLTEKLVYATEHYAEVKEQTKFEKAENNTQRTADWILEYATASTQRPVRLSKRSGNRSKLRRISEMRWEEVRERSRQEFTKRWDVILYRLAGRKDNERSSIAQRGRVSRFFFSPEDVPTLLATMRERFPSATDQTINRADSICNHEFDLLGYERLNYGPKIDWHWDAVHKKKAPFRPWFEIRYLNFDEVGDSKITWELNRHQHFVTLAKAYRLTEEERFAKEIFRQWADWHDANPYPIGINWASSLEVAFRSLSWLWTWRLLDGSSSVPRNFVSDLHRALSVNGRHIEKYLSTYFSPNTHLLGEGVALFFLGVLCPDLPRALRWRTRGWEVVLQEAKRQVRPDGMHFEQSTYYHVYALDFFLHARMLASANGVPIPEELDQTIEKMLDFLATLAHAGLPPRLGDDHGGRLFDPSRNQAEHLLDPLAIGAAVFGRADLKAAAGVAREETLWLLGLQGLTRFDQLQPELRALRSVSYRESGIFVMADSLPAKEQLVIDAGPQGSGSAGHGHADALSVCLAVDGYELLCDPGTYCYVSSDDSRNAFRGTAAHNTLRIDEQDQAAPAGPFSWESLTETEVECWNESKASDFFQGTHKGYTRLPGTPVHRRTVFHLKSGLWLVHDLAAGTGEHALDLYWHLSPSIRIAQHSVNSFFIRSPSQAIAILTPEQSNCAAKIENGCWSPAYGQRQPASVLRLQQRGALPVEFCTLLVSLGGERSGPGRLLPVRTKESTVSSYCYLAAEEIHVSAFAKNGSPWQAGRIRSDARFLYVIFDLREQAKYFALSDGSFVQVDEHTLFSADRRAEYHEWFAGISDSRRDPVSAAESVTVTREDD